MSSSSNPTLTAIFQITCIFAALVFVGSQGIVVAREVIAKASVRSGLGTFSMTSHTNVEAAHVTLTNQSNDTTWACMKGVVTNDVTSVKATSHVVCSGEVKPHSTVTLDTPFKIGAVLDICNKPGFGEGKVVDWSKCTFEIIDVTNQIQ